MFVIISIILEVIILGLLYIIVTKNKSIKRLKKEVLYNDKTIALQKNEVLSYKDASEQLRSRIDTIEIKYNDFIAVFANANRKVYAQGNFYDVYSVYNNRFYAKVNNKPTHNKVEGIPIVELPNNKNSVIDLYKVLHLIKRDPYIDIEIVIKNSTILKEEMILKLGNKNLKPYVR